MSVVVVRPPCGNPATQWAATPVPGAFNPYVPLS